MDKKSILAIVLCVIVIMAGSWISVIKQNNAVEASAQEEVLNQATQEVQPSVSEKSDWN